MPKSPRSRKSPKSTPPPTAGWSVVSGSLKQLGSNTIIGDAPADEFVPDVTISIKRRQALPDLPREGSARERKAQYAATYGADPEAIARVEKFARDYELKVERSSIAERHVIVSGTVAQINRAFDIRLKTMRSPDGKTFRGRTGVIKVPANLEDLVCCEGGGVFGLDERRFARPHFRVDPTSAGPGIRAHAAGGLPGFTPVQVAKAYNFPTGLTGAGEVIGIIELGGGYRPSELQTYFQKIGVSPAPSVVEGTHPFGGANSPGTDPLDPDNPDVEVLLDIEVAGAVAPGAQIVVYFAPDASDQSFIDVLTAAIHDPAHDLSIISISWGGPEGNATDQFQKRFHQVLETARHLGVTVCVAAGDDGSADFPFHDPRRPWDGHAHVDYPASDPLTLACGGTLLRVIGASISESVWHPRMNVGTGGGISRVFPLPDYQANSRVPKAVNPAGPVKRGVPDVAGNAAQESGYHVLCDGQFFPDPASGIPPVGGTSAVAPLWAGLVALLNQGLGRRLGFINPQLYALSPGTGAFQDIANGNNGDYQAGAGWDACTGLGTPNGQKLLAALRNPQAQPAAAAAESAGEVTQPSRPSGTGSRPCDKRLEVLDRLLRVAELIMQPCGGATAPKAEGLTSGRAARAATQSVEDVIIDCIGRQIGTDQLSLTESLGDAGIDGFALATCINEALGTLLPARSTTIGSAPRSFATS